MLHAGQHTHPFDDRACGMRGQGIHYALDVVEQEVMEEIQSDRALFALHGFSRPSLLHLAGGI
jgi:hypothetical protein